MRCVSHTMYAPTADFTKIKK